MEDSITFMPELTYLEYFPNNRLQSRRQHVQIHENHLRPFSHKISNYVSNLKKKTGFDQYSQHNLTQLFEFYFIYLVSVRHKLFPICFISNSILSKRYGNKQASPMCTRSRFSTNWRQDERNFVLNTNLLISIFIWKKYEMTCLLFVMCHVVSVWLSFVWGGHTRTRTSEEDDKCESTCVKR